MSGSLARMREELRRYWVNYVFQSLLATGALLVVILVLTLQEAVVVASIGATVFIVFATPESLTAQPRNVVGGHIVGILSGALAHMIPHSTFTHSITVYALAVGVSMFIMVVTDTEHPPASGTALSVAMSGPSLGLAAAIVASAAVLSLIHRLLRPYLRDLT
jgi:CBS-domain-containing membrane protein